MTSNKTVDEPKVFNYVSSVEQPLLWSQFLALSTKYHQPSVRSLWIPSLWTTPYKTVQRVLHVFLHLLPAYTIDTIFRVFGVQTGSVWSQNLRNYLFENILTYEDIEIIHLKIF